jgi:hypothetical protein
MIRTEQMEFVNRTGIYSMTPEHLDDAGLAVRVCRATFAPLSLGDATPGNSASCDSGDVFHGRVRVQMEFLTFGGRL